MRHHSTKKIFGRTRRQRAALMRGLALSLIDHGRITTTEAKAKALRPFIEPLVTKAKSQTVFSRRFIIRRLGSTRVDLTKKLVDEIAPKFADRAGGYTRVLKLPARQGDASPMAIIEFVA